MRYLAAGILLLLLLTTLCMASACYVDHAVAETQRFVQSAAENQEGGSTNEAIGMMEKAALSWSYHDKFFGIVLHHDEIDSVREDMSALLGCLYSSAYEEFPGTCAGLITRLQQLRNAQWPKLRNLF